MHGLVSVRCSACLVGWFFVRLGFRGTVCGRRGLSWFGFRSDLGGTAVISVFILEDN